MRNKSLPMVILYKAKPKKLPKNTYILTYPDKYASEKKKTVIDQISINKTSVTKTAALPKENA